MSSGVQIIVIVAVVIAAAIWIGVVQRRGQRAAFRRKLLESFGKIPEKRMSSERYARIPALYQRHLPADGIDDITWNDLDMDAVYRRIDSTQSAAGEEYLYALLRSPVPNEPSDHSAGTASVRYVSVSGLGAAPAVASSAASSSEVGPVSNGGSPAASAAAIPLQEIRLFENSANQNLRISLQVALHRFGHLNRYSLYEYLDRLKNVRPDSNWKHLPAFLLPVISIIVLILNVPAGVVCLILSMIFNMATYYHYKGKADPYIQTCVYLLRMMRCADELIDADVKKVMPEEGTRLSKLQKGFASIRRGSGILISGSASSGGNPVDFILDYIRILFHIDLIKFNSMLAEVQKQQREIDEELTIIGRIDTAIALASFEKSLPCTCEPVFQEGHSIYSAAAGINRKGNVGVNTDAADGDDQRNINQFALYPDGNSAAAGRLKIEDLYHPLLEKPVSNSIDTDRSVLLTGSNASGKSTFLKSIALCALFAQTIGFCPARSYAAPHFRIRSSMALRDNILNGESYFMVEIRSLKRIADLSGDGGLPVLCFIDEVLRGTNTIERIAASSEILESLAEGGNILCFAATHDIELTGLLKGSFDNYHFEEELGSEDVVFSYKLHRGPATTRNAIRLLDKIGFDRSITEKAEKRAEHFEENGEWK